MVLEDEHEIVVSFGAMQSHWPDFSDSKEAKKRANTPLPSVIANYAGLTPLCYKQADALMEQLKVYAKEQNKPLVVTGQSLAGSIASYVALKHEVKGVCFNPVQLGAGLQWDIGDAKLAQADKYVTNISVANDHLNNFPGVTAVDRVLSHLGVRTPGNFGKRYRIPSAFKKKTQAHDFPMKSIMQYLGYHKDTKATELKPEDIIRSK